MDNKSVINIDIDDKKFREFYKLFIGFTRNLEETSNLWADLNSKIEKSTEALKSVLGVSGDVTKEFEKINQELKDTNEAGREFKKEIQGAKKEIHIFYVIIKKILKPVVKISEGIKTFYLLIRKTWKISKKIASSFGKIAKLVYRIGKGLTAFGVVGASLSGLATLWGLRELANSAVSRQRMARGIGDTPGRVTAFKTDYGRYVSPDMLNSIAASKGTMTGRMWLSRSTGRSMEDVQSMRPTQIAQLAIMSAKKWWDATPSAIRTQEYAKTKGFQESGLSWQDIRRIGATSMKDLRTAGRQFKGDVSAFGFSDKSAHEWYALSRQFMVAGNTIESTLTKKLAGLATPLSGLIESVTADFSALMDSELTPKNIKALGSAFHSAAEFIGSKEFINNIKRFGTAVGDAADMVVSFVRFFGGEKQVVPVASEASLSYRLKMLGNISDTMPGNPRLSMQQEYANEKSRLHDFLYPNDVNVNITNGTGGDLSTSINGLGY